LLLSLAASVSSTAADRPTVSVARLEQKPLIDGRVDEVEWAAAAYLDQTFTQIEPEFGRPSRYRTVVRIATDGTALYVAFEAFDPQLDRLSVAVTSRDGKMDADDSVAVMLDTFQDARRAYVFRTNALGTQWDARVADNGRTLDVLWDTEWRCAAQRLEDRWTVEFEIPFSALRFRPGRDRGWGLNLMRTVPRRLETSLWAGTVEDRWRVSGFGKLDGLDLQRRAAKTWEAIPYALAAAELDSDTEFEVGGDLRWRPSSSLGVDLTINPDFALIEADVEVINLTRFELFIPEKRPFFLEGNEKFSQRIRQFYSRRIGDIVWGGKGTGAGGGVDYSVIVTSEDVQADETGRTARADYGVARLQYSLPRGSTIGLLGANRRLRGEDQGSVGLDTSLFFTDTLGMTAQLIRVHGADADDGLAWFVRPAYDSATTHFHVRYTNLDRNISNDFNAVGFLLDDNRREFDTNLTHTFWIRGGAAEKIQAGANYNRYYDQDGVLRSWEFAPSASVVFRSRWWAAIKYTDEFKLFEKEFRNDRTALTVGWDSRAGRSFFVFGETGKNFDSDFVHYGGNVEWAVGDRVRLGYSVTRLELDPDPKGATTWIHVFDARYAFTPDLFLKLFLQVNSAIDKENVQATFVWRFRPPFGSLQVAYQRGTSEVGQQSDQGDTFLTKLSWVF
jgi:hypothetical protein